MESYMLNLNKKDYFDTTLYNAQHLLTWLNGNKNCDINVLKYVIKKCFYNR